MSRERFEVVAQKVIAVANGMWAGAVIWNALLSLDTLIFLAGLFQLFLIGISGRYGVKDDGCKHLSSINVTLQVVAKALSCSYCYSNFSFAFDSWIFIWC